MLVRFAIRHLLVKFANGFRILAYCVKWRTRLSSIAEPLVISQLLVFMVYDIFNLYKIRFFTGEEVN